MAMDRVRIHVKEEEEEEEETGACLVRGG